MLDLRDLRDLVAWAVAVLLAAFAVSLAACAGASPQARPAPQSSAVVEPSSPRVQACEVYARSVGPFLDRFNLALDTYEAGRAGAEDGADRADSVRVLSDYLHEEVEQLRGVRVDDAELKGAHDDLVVALNELVLALDQQATALTLGDQDLRVTSLKRRSEAWNRWSAAFAAIVTRCDTGESPTRSRDGEDPA